MRVIALEMGFHGGTRRRPGAEFDMEPYADGTLPKWVVAADERNRVDIARKAAHTARREIDAVIAAAGPKRDGRPGAIPTNTGLADATAEAAPAKVVTPSWYPPSPVEKAVAAAHGLEAVPAAPAPDAALSDLA